MNTLIVEKDPHKTSRFADFLELTKPRITLLVILTSWVGFFVAAPTLTAPILLLHTLLGTALACSGSSALNMVWEHDRDLLMHRTQLRPIPAGRLSVDEGMWFGVTLAVIGILELAFFVNLLAALLTVGTLVLYLFAYTPSKKVTWLSTTIGAVPGALPPMIGWAAARGTLEPGAWALFAIQFIWQLPHFYALAWMYREDYERGGFPVLTVLDREGNITMTQIVSWTAVLVPVSLLLTLHGNAGWLYAISAVVFGLGFLGLSFGLVAQRTRAKAKRVFLASVLYLPAILGALVVDNLLSR